MILYDIINGITKAIFNLAQTLKPTTIISKRWLINNVRVMFYHLLVFTNMNYLNYPLYYCKK